MTTDECHRTDDKSSEGGEVEWEVFFETPEMRHPSYGIFVERYLMGQYRIHLTHKGSGVCSRPGHGEIVQDLCTYEIDTLLTRVIALIKADHPLELARSWAHPAGYDGAG